VANKKYIERLLMVIFQLHGCDSKHIESVPVHEVFQGKTVWQRNVDVFDMIRYPLAKRCYGWTYGEPEEFIIILELPPVTDAQSAVKVGVSYQQIKVEASFRIKTRKK
jgi:hypothetical protein